MVTMLKKLTSGAMLSPLEASEEFRSGIIRCFRAMVLQLQPCSERSCSCKQATVLPTTSTNTNLETGSVVCSKLHAHPEECLLAFLQSQNASAAVGHWLSLLLQVWRPSEYSVYPFLLGKNDLALVLIYVFSFFFIRKASELEASRGHRGSADVRKEALHALRILIAKVRTEKIHRCSCDSAGRNAEA